MSTISCKIDHKTIERLTRQQRSSGQRLTLSDTACAGLKLVINSQSASWVYTYRKRGYLDGGRRHPQRTMKLGDPATMTPAAARLAAEQVKAQVRAGQDPAAIERQEKAERLASEARQKACGDWLERYATGELSGGKTKHQRDGLMNVRSALDELGLADALPEVITSKHVRALIEMHSSKPATARHRYGAFSRFLDFLMDEEVIDLNPAQAISKKRRPKPPEPRIQFFSPDELKKLWHSEGLKPEYLRYLRFMITTPLRADEGASLRWDQVHAERSELRLTPNDTKNSQHFVMPLTSVAWGLIGEPPQQDRAKVFQLTRYDDGAMSSWSYFNKSVRRASGVENFALHHLRRTFSTLLAENTSTPFEVVDGLLNHKQSVSKGGVVRHYQHAKQLSQRRATMEAWAELLTNQVVQKK
jgi:integrase